ncbi:MAG: dihydrolipoamide acetyltransferase family protein [Gemmataceae bacterium]
MATEIKLPPLGENLEEGEVLDVKVSAGDTVAEGQALLEVEAEKSTVEVPAPRAGKIAEMLVKKGDVIQVGQVLCRLEEGNGAALRTDGEKVDADTRRRGDGEKDDAETRRRGDGEKDDAETRRRGDGEKDDAKTRRRGDKEKDEAKLEPAAPRAESVATKEHVVPAGPATRGLARELGIDLHRVTGSARGGRVTIEDLKAFVRQLAKQSSDGVSVAAPALPDFSRWGPVEQHKLEPIRRRTAEAMARAWGQVAHVTQHDECDITELDAFRREASDERAKLTVTAFALKAAALALKKYPQFNSSLDLAGNLLVVKGYYHIGVAVDTERGLLVPVVRDVDQKGVRQLAVELAELAERARKQKLSADDMKGGTFTITNLGGIGGTAFTPIVNWPEVAILGMSRGKLQPVVRGGQVETRLMLPLSLSYDHRVIDGADAARFTRFLAELLEKPVRMLL